VGDRRAPGSPWLPLGALLLLAVALRFATLTTQSLWFDEAATHDIVRLGLWDMLHQLPHKESNPPLFYVLEWGWTRVFGSGPFGLRSLSALAGVLTVPVAYALGRQLAGARAAFAVGALVAVNPLLVWLSQEARSYALVVLWSALGLLLFLRCLDDERPRLLGWWTLASGLALTTHYFAAFVLLPQGAWLLWRHPRRRAAIAAVGALLVLCAALLPMLLAQRGNPYDISSGSIAVRLLQVPKQFLLGYRGPLQLPLGLLAGLLVLGGAWLLVRETDPGVRRRAAGVAAIAAIGLVLPLLAAVVGADYLNARNLVPALVPLLVALGVAYGASRRPLLGAALAAGLCAVSLVIVIAVPLDKAYQRADWKGVAKALGTTPFARAVIGSGEQPLAVYRRALRPMSYYTGATIREVDVVAVATGDTQGDTPHIPPVVGSAVPGFTLVQHIHTSSYELLRFRALAPVHVLPDAVATVRFGDRAPSIDLLPGGR
jgi:4-amino-4-deoxy-L-arabinose transferase-like glycosyltransferase